MKFKFVEVEDFGFTHYYEKKISLNKTSENGKNLDETCF